MTMMSDHQKRAFEEFTTGMPPEQKEQVRVELEARLKHRAEQRVHEIEAMKAAHFAQLTQHEINTAPRRQYAAIVAVDEKGGFSKDGEIPWNYPEDFKWFQQTTSNQICVMGRATYDDINKRLGDKAQSSVLPNRRCFVVTSSPLPRDNATAVTSIGEVDKYIIDEDISKMVFFIGGERIYREGIAKADTAYITVVNKDVEADLFFPVNYVLKHFNMDKMFKAESAPDLRFTVWRRK
jgi:dihydrofolate reductase